MARKRKAVEVIPGKRLQPGDVIDMAVGPTLCLRVKAECGGVSWVGCHPDGGATRSLFAWANGPLRVMRRDPKALERVLKAEAERKEKARDEAA